MAHITTIPDEPDRDLILDMAHRTFWKTAQHIDYLLDLAHRDDPGEGAALGKHVTELHRNLNTVMDRLAKVEAEQGKGKGNDNGIQFDLDHAREDVQLRLAVLAEHIGTRDVSD